MQVLKGTKREITIMQWQEQIEKYMKRANDCMECFKLYHNSDDLIHLAEDCEKLIEICNHAKKLLNLWTLTILNNRLSRRCAGIVCHTRGGRRL